VLYIALGEGNQQAHEAHAALNRGLLRYDEPFEYRPHITLMVPHNGVDVTRVHKEAAEQWAQFRETKKFRVDRLDFLRQHPSGVWENMRQIDLAGSKIEEPA
jgi:2'-5' RNA ligase